MTERGKIEDQYKTPYISTRQARDILYSRNIKATLPTLIAWCRKYKLGYMIGGRWQVDKANLIKFIEGRWITDEK
jgi:hypothetical protein